MRRVCKVRIPRRTGETVIARPRRAVATLLRLDQRDARLGNLGWFLDQVQRFFGLGFLRSGFCCGLINIYTYIYSVLPDSEP